MRGPICDVNQCVLSTMLLSQKLLSPFIRVVDGAGAGRAVMLEARKVTVSLE